jgi:hypothetical protein
MKNRCVAVVAAFFMISTVVSARPATAADSSGDDLSGYSCSGPVLELTPEQQKWFAVFLEGTFYARGWKEITHDILARTPVELREKQKTALMNLGIKIGLEWSKDNDVRRIDTDMLKKWGELLQESAERGPEHIDRVIVEIERNVENLLN